MSDKKELLLITYHLSLITALNSFNYPARRSAFDEGEREGAPACGFCFFAPVNLVESVIAAFDENVGEDSGNQRARADVVKDCDVINGAQCGEHLCALLFVHHGAARAFQFTH